MIAALYVEKDGVYFGLPDVDPWDEARDARKYAGPWPVVAHPPCERWSLLAAIHVVRSNRAIGDDAGCFKSALESVRKWGGVLEHPAFTYAWSAHGLPRPPRNGWQRTIDGDWVCHVYQGNYGHRANKGTWLYAHGINPDSLSWGKKNESTVDVEHQSRKERKKSPIAFRDLLLSIARTCLP